VKTHLNLDSLGSILDGTSPFPKDLLGAHAIEDQQAWAVRGYFPGVQQAWLVDQRSGATLPMRRLHPWGFYEGVLPRLDDPQPPAYRFKLSGASGNVTHQIDPYSVGFSFSDFDRYLFGSGNHWKIYEKLGAHLRSVDGHQGVNFAVWAPNAQSVQVVGDFNHWDGRAHMMHKQSPSGIWELFVPDIGNGMKYKFRVRSIDGGVIDKADPLAFYSELPPRTASIVHPLEYRWQDSEWIAERAENRILQKPVSIYEVHLGSWRKCDSANHGWLGYRELAHQLVEYCKQMGFTHLELMPVSEHPFSGSWGYQTTGYFSVTSRYGSPEDFMYFVDYCHQHSIGVIIDWVPAHFPRDAHGLYRFDGTALYEHEDPRQGEHPDWGTMVFNYSRHEVRNFLISNALFWFDKFHIDGLRVDAVASMLYLDYSRKEGEWIPNHMGGRENLAAVHFVREFNRQCHAEYPGILTIAEESTAWAGVSHPVDVGGLGFSMKWNMGWMNDTLRYMRRDPIHRKHHQNDLTFSLIYAYSENFQLPLSHDEVVHGKGSLIGQMPGDLWQKFANLRLLFSYMWTHPGKKMLFMGGELAQWHEWNYDAQLQWELLQWETHAGIQRLVADLNRLHASEKSLHRFDFSGEGFEWIDCRNAHDSVLVYLRKSHDAQSSEHLLVCCNFTPVVRPYRVGVPFAGGYREIFNSNASIYGGSGIGNPGVIYADAQVPYHAQNASLELTIPPLGAVILKPLQSH
jgi:1,4-alpha-glucan branching enzyme